MMSRPNQDMSTHPAATIPSQSVDAVSSNSGVPIKRKPFRFGSGRRPLKPSEPPEKNNGGHGKTAPGGIADPQGGLSARDALEASPFYLEGFIRIDNSDKPERVSDTVWSGIFPPDRKRVRRVAGRHFLAGLDPDEAVLMAEREVSSEAWQRDPLARLLSDLGPLFPDWNASQVQVPGHIANACIAVQQTATKFHGKIVGFREPEKMAFICRTWRAEPGRCLICNRRADLNGRFLKVYPGDDAGDFVHTGCLQYAGPIGRKFSELVCGVAARINSELRAELSALDEIMKKTEVSDSGEDDIKWEF